MDKSYSKEINLELIKDNTATQCRHCGNVATQIILFDEKIQEIMGINIFKAMINYAKNDVEKGMHHSMLKRIFKIATSNIIYLVLIALWINSEKNF